jgi:CBS domain-containing protein
MKSTASKLALIISGTTFTTGALRVAWSAIRRRPERVVADVMTPEPVRISARASAHAAATRMAEEGVGALAVCNEREQPIGVITDRDLVVRLLAQGEDPVRTTINDCLDGKLETVDVNAPLSEATAQMKTAAVRRLPVLRAGKLAGILTVADITEHDPATAIGLERALVRSGDDNRSAAWLFRKPYRRTDEPHTDASRASRIADGQLTTTTRNMLAETRADTSHGDH